MSVVIQYVVERNGVAKMTFTSKQQADAYDKMLDIAEQLAGLLVEHQLLDEEQADQVAMFMAQRKDEISQLLQGKLKPAKKAESIEQDVGQGLQSEHSDTEAHSHTSVQTLNLVNAA